MELKTIFKCLLWTFVNNHKKTYANILGEHSIYPLNGKFAFLYKWIIEKTNHFSIDYKYKLKQRIHWILNDLHEFPKCNNPECNKILDDPKYFKNINIGYVHHCCSKCINNDPNVRQQIKNTCIQKYGTNCSLHGKEASLKTLQTIKAHYGKEITNVFQAKEVISKIANIKSNYNEKQKNNISQKSKHTRYKKYNGKYESAETKLKRKNTFELKYGKGIINAGQTPAHKNMFLNNPEKLKKCKEKERITKIKNNSYAKSKLEDKCYLALCKVFNYVERQYISIKYPFKCDFYIKDIDTYIEINGYWTHGKHAFNSNNIDDLKIIEQWKTKNTKLYNVAIFNWTVTDVLKRTTAKNNNLNYLEFWTYEQFNMWLNKVINYF